MENKNKNTKSDNKLKDIAKNIDKSIESKKESKTTKLSKSSIVHGSSKLGFPEQKKQIPLSLELLNKDYTFYEKASFSNKSIGSLKSYGYNTFHGLFKEINEDKIIVINQIKKPASSKMKTWPKISYFGIFDGHGGEGCSEFLKNNLLNYLIDNKNFPFDIKTGLTESFEKAEEEFFKLKCSGDIEHCDKSGSCALVSILFDNKIYIANLGDSRAIMSMNSGTKVKQLTNDHKPDNPKEFERVIKNGSKIYIDDNDDPHRDPSKLNFIKDKAELEKSKSNNKSNEEMIFRVYPSDLAVTKSIGDIKAKKKEFGGKQGSIINKPDIFIHDINSTDDFLVMGCDGIFDDLSNQEVSDAAWFVFKNLSKEKNYDIHELSQDACDIIMKFALEKQTSDNLSCIVIGFEGLEKFLKNKSTKEKVNNSINNFKKNHKTQTYK
jgi:serine/threonine protein phosphatase PrpC